MKPLVIYHANCVDGFGAAFAAWLKLGDEAEYLPCQYGDKGVYNTKIDGRDIYILDFSFKLEQMDDLFANAESVTWLDHHKTAFEMWCGGTPADGYHTETIGGNCGFIELDNNKSGAYLAWEYFHPHTEVPMLIKHIDDYDRWQFKLDGTKSFNKALWSYAPWSFQQWSDLLHDSRNQPPYDSFIAQGNAILRAHDQNVQSVVKGSARKCELFLLDRDWEKVKTLGLRTGLAANCPPHLTSDVGHELATQSGAFGLCWTLSQTGFIAKCSLRSNGDYDVSAIAKVFGGGGHRNASGFEVYIQTLLGWLK